MPSSPSYHALWDWRFVESASFPGKGSRTSKTGLKPRTSANPIGLTAALQIPIINHQQKINPRNPQKSPSAQITALKLIRTRAQHFIGQAERCNPELPDGPAARLSTDRNARQAQMMIIYQWLDKKNSWRGCMPGRSLRRFGLGRPRRWYRIWLGRMIFWRGLRRCTKRCLVTLWKNHFWNRKVGSAGPSIQSAAALSPGSERHPMSRRTKSEFTTIFFTTHLGKRPSGRISSNTQACFKEG